MGNLVALFFLIVGFLGVNLVLGRKAYYIQKEGIKVHIPRLKWRQILRKYKINFINVERILKKVLLKIRGFFSNGENFIDKLLKKLSSSKKFQEDYWEKIKKDHSSNK